jgi:ATP-binding protein involved in chromosome partitioning
MVFGLNKKLDLDKDGKRDALMAAFAEIVDSTLDKPITDAGFIEGVSGDKGKANVHVKLPSMAWRGRADIVADIEKRAQDIMGDVPVVMNVESDVRPAAGDSFDKQTLDGVRNVVLVASGKGGVGKSTIATNLAVALGQRGCKVGLLDADVYGPSLPTMFGFVDGTRPGTMPGDNPDRPKIVPLERHGIKLMSIGFLVDTSTPMVWRGPMIASACMQLFKDVSWGELDYLIVDLPPGTGDIHLTISQQVLVAGALVVSTPQDVALADVIRAKNMFDKVSIPTIGIVENMSYFICDGCDKRHEIFTHGGARRAAEKLAVPFLGEVPLEPSVRAGGDEGTPAVLSHPTSASSKAFIELAETMATELALTARQIAKQAGGAGPTIQITGGKGAGGKKKGGLPILN